MSEPPNSTARPYKRRRPALSCENCRQRKIKCDRNYPCGQCLRSRTLSCRYSADVSRRVNNATSTALPSVQTSFRIQSRSIPSSSSTHASSLGLSPSSAHLSNATHPSSYSSPVAASPDSKALLDRIQELETQVAIYKSELSKVEISRCGRATGLPSTPPNSTPKELRGTVSKTRFFGTSHWMYSYGAYDKIRCLSANPSNHISDSLNTSSTLVYSIKELMEKCKTLAKSIKAVPYSQWLANPDFRGVLPQREISDQFVDAYFRTSESIYRILHIPSFHREYKQYWDQPDAANPVFIIKLLLVLSIGGCFYQGPNFAHYRTEAMKWIFAAQTWLSSPFEKAKLHTSTIQIQCLLIIARQYYSISGDLVWISAGTLLRTAIQMGFHRDPKGLPRMSTLQAEMRRKLWATILELNIQSSIVSGMPFLISEQDWDTEPPANIDDIDINDTTTDPIIPKPSTIFTQATLQILLLLVFRPRLEVIQYSNNIRSEHSYDDAIRVGAELSKACRDNKNFISRVNQTRESEAKVTQLNINLFDLSIRLFLLILHRPFASKGMEDPHFYFSRKTSLEAAVTMLNYPSSEPPTTNKVANNIIRDDYAQFKIMNGGFLKGIIVYAAVVIFQELYTQLEEEGPSFTQETKASRETLKQCLRDTMALTADRITTGENNVMGHLLLSVFLAQVEATEEGVNPDLVILETAKTKLLFCYDLLSARMVGIHDLIPVDTDPSGDLQDYGSPQDFGKDFTFQEWSIDQDIQGPWLQSACEDGVWWHW